MKKKMTSLLARVLIPVLLAGASMFAQDAPPPIPPPEAPFVRKPADYARWLVKFDRAKAAPGQNRADDPAGTVFYKDTMVKINSIEYAKTGDIGYYAMTLADGARLVRWSVGRMLLSTYPGNTQVYLTKLTVLTPVEERFMEDYPGFDWLDIKSYVGVVDFAGVKCYAFHKDSTEGKSAKQNPNDPASQMVTPENMNRSHSSQDAWVTVDGHWPVAFRDAAGLRKYTHLQPPQQGQKLQLPDAFKSQLDTYFGVK